MVYGWFYGWLEGCQLSSCFRNVVLPIFYPNYYYWPKYSLQVLPKRANSQKWEKSIPPSTHFRIIYSLRSFQTTQLPTTHPLTPTKTHPRKNVFLWGFSLNCFSRWCLENFPRICLIPRHYKSIFVLQSREGGGGGCFHNKHA